MSAHSRSLVKNFVAVIGSPNSGKTTLFNWLTGSRFKTVNYPGSTVDCFRGETLSIYGDPISVMDTPGVYSLLPQALDEEVTVNVLLNRGEGGRSLGAVQAVIVVVDGMQLSRQLYLVRQVQAMGIPFVLALTMGDLLKRGNLQIDFSHLAKLVNAPVVLVDGTLGGGVNNLVSALRELLSGAEQSPQSPQPIEWDAARITEEQGASEAWAFKVMQEDAKKSDGAAALMATLRKWDRWLLHPILGVIVFLLIMGGLFSSIFWLAAPAMDLVDLATSKVAEGVYSFLGPSAISDFLANGVVAGFGAILVFVPQIFILFFGFTLLEDSGYLARAATIVDRPLQKLGLSGRSFVPILSSFACAVPAVLAARNLSSSRERWITIFILPLMTCSARLPVYALLFSFMFAGQPAWQPGLALAALYLASLILGGVAALILNRMLKRQKDSYFLMELPFYRWPKPSVALRTAFLRTYSYVHKAGPTIFVLLMVLWIGGHYPQGEGLSSTAQLEQSYLGQVGKWLEPIFTPMGLDWRAGVGLLSAFVAREVFVSALAVIFNIADTVDSSLQHTLLTKMHEAVGVDGQPVFTTASVMGLLVFFMLALQCLSTTGVTAREMNSWRFAIVQLIAWNVIAYVLAVATVQVLS